MAEDQPVQPVWVGGGEGEGVDGLSWPGDVGWAILSEARAMLNTTRNQKEKTPTRKLQLTGTQGVTLGAPKGKTLVTEPVLNQQCLPGDVRRSDPDCLWPRIAGGGPGMGTFSPRYKSRQRLKSCLLRIRHLRRCRYSFPIRHRLLRSVSSLRSV